MLTVHDLKLYVDQHVRETGATFGGTLHTAVDRFVAWVDHEEAIKDAKKILEADGYTVNPPPASQEINTTA